MRKSSSSIWSAASSPEGTRWRRRPLPYDFILIDCPPSLESADAERDGGGGIGKLVPLQMRVLCAGRFVQLIKTVERVKRHFNPVLEIQGVVLTHARQALQPLNEQVASDVRAHFGAKVYETAIRATSASPRRRVTASPPCSTIIRCAGSPGLYPSGGRGPSARGLRGRSLRAF